MRLDHLWHDLRFALRQFGRRPGLTSAALLALTCGLGGVTTVFTLVDAVILRPLPVAAPHELVWMREGAFSYPTFQQVRARGHMLSKLFAWNARTFHAQWTNEPEPTTVLLATGAIHETLGLRPAVGRLLEEADAGDSPAEAQPVAVLSYAAWRRHFGADPAALGRTFRIEGMPFTIVGVTPPEFFGVAVGMRADVTIPLTMLPRLREEERDTLTNGGRSWLNIMGRLRPGLTVPQADAAFQTIWPLVLQATAPAVSADFRPRYLTFTSGLEPGATGYSPVRRQFHDALWLLFGLVGLLLVAACATVANLLLAVVAGRRQELALRLALGAGRRRIVQQLFVEGLLLAIGGAVLGLLFSAWATDGLVRLLSTSYETVVVDITPDRRVFAFVALAVGIATIVFTVAPVARAAGIDPGGMLEAGRRHTGGLHRSKTSQALVIAQVAISLTLVAGSALFARNLWGLLATDVGFDPGNLLVVTVDALSPVSARASAPTASRLPYYAELVRRLGEVPGVRAVSLSRKPPISNEQGSWWTRFQSDTGALPPNPGERNYLNAISPGYFSTIGTPIVAGRDFAWTDREGSPRVVIVNTTLARAYFGTESPLGRHLLMGTDTRLEVVGVVPDTTYQNLQEARRRTAYLPYTQVPEMLNTVNLQAELRVTGSSAAVAEGIRAAVRSVDSSAPLTIQSVESRIDESLVGERLITVIAAFLGIVSLLLACGALGGLMSHLVAMRTREIGVRLALGADRRTVLGLILRQALTIAVAGAAAGLGLTLAGGPLVSRFLHGIGPADPWALTGAVAILLATTALAAYLPARRATRIEPMAALRQE